jgi:hypothetical protein
MQFQSENESIDVSLVVPPHARVGERVPITILVCSGQTRTIGLASVGRVVEHAAESRGLPRDRCELRIDAGQALQPRRIRAAERRGDRQVGIRFRRLLGTGSCKKRCECDRRTGTRIPETRPSLQTADHMQFHSDLPSCE